jgi:hypothetical protein
VAGVWRRLHSEALHIWYASQSVVWVIISRRMRWACYVAHMGAMKNAYIWVGKSEGKDHSQVLDLDGRIILEWILKKWFGKGVDWIHLNQDRDQRRDLVNTVMNLRVP